jgi:succinate-semialdehyde dehydrogenase / glutarate-semialdehyde dehydrogenase
VTLPVRNPRTGEHDYAIEPLREAELDSVSQRLRDAQPGWATRPAQERAEALHRWADALEASIDTVADALTLDTGRRGISRIEAIGTVRLIRRWADAAPDLISKAAGGARATSIPTITARTRLVPYPLVGVISPWNFPLTLALIDAVPALAAGCAAIVKPSEVTPRFIRPLVETLTPEIAEVLAIVEGDGTTGAALVERVDFICFTGSAATGRKVGEAAARAFIPASLELGGKDPMIVLASADPVTAAATALRASIVNAGQACQSIERIYVAREIAEPFLAELVRQAKAVRLNSDDLGAGEIGPFIFARQADIVRVQIEDARAKGAVILTGGEIEAHGGLYLRPTVLRDVTPQMRIMTEETFGPVLPVAIFNSVDEAVALANSGDFGLSAAVLGGTAEEAEAIAARLEAGAVSINDGALTSMVWEAEKSSFKLSGLGPSRMGESGLTRFFRRQAILRQSGDPAPIAAYSEEALR